MWGKDISDFQMRLRSQSAARLFSFVDQISEFGFYFKGTGMSLEDFMYNPRRPVET